MHVTRGVLPILLLAVLIIYFTGKFWDFYFAKKFKREREIKNLIISVPVYNLIIF